MDTFATAPESRLGLQLVSLGNSFNKSMFSVIKRAEGFNDRLAIYKDDTLTNFKIWCNKVPTQKQILAIRKRLYRREIPVNILLIMPNSSIQIKGFTFKELATVEDDNGKKVSIEVK